MKQTVYSKFAVLLQQALPLATPRCFWDLLRWTRYKTAPCSFAGPASICIKIMASVRDRNLKRIVSCFLALHLFCLKWNPKNPIATVMDLARKQCGPWGRRGPSTHLWCWIVQLRSPFGVITNITHQWLWPHPVALRLDHHRNCICFDCWKK